MHMLLYIQLRLKEERDAKRAQIDERHHHILTLVADSLGVEKSEVDDAILEGNQVSKLESLALAMLIYSIIVIYAFI